MCTLFSFFLSLSFLFLAFKRKKQNENKNKEIYQRFGKRKSFPVVGVELVK